MDRLTAGGGEGPGVAPGHWSLGGSPRLPMEKKSLFGSGLDHLGFFPVLLALGTWRSER